LVNPKERLTVDQIMSHPWLSAEDTLTHKNMPEVQEAIKQYTIKMRWHKAGLMVMAANRFKKVLELKVQEEEKKGK